jgi:hypothetical protein
LFSEFYVFYLCCLGPSSTNFNFIQAILLQATQQVLCQFCILLLLDMKTLLMALTYISPTFLFMR